MRPKDAFILILAAAAIVAAVMPGERRGDAKLEVGDPAPPLLAGKWIRGRPVARFEPGKVYLIEFWATWCGPCRISIPRLNALSKRFEKQGLVVIGQNVRENDERAVASFVQQMGDNMSYRVALDDRSEEPDGIMAVNWVMAAKRPGIPTGFVIDKNGRVAWIGHPMELTEEFLQSILSAS